MDAKSVVAEFGNKGEEGKTVAFSRDTVVEHGLRPAREPAYKVEGTSGDRFSMQRLLQNDASRGESLRGPY